MTFSRSDIRRLEDLSRIELGDEERERLGLQLARIVEFVRVLRDADRAGADGERPPAGGTGAPLRGDVPGECLDREEVLAAAPAREGGYFRVPPVIETEGS